MHIVPAPRRGSPPAASDPVRAPRCLRCPDSFCERTAAEQFGFRRTLRHPSRPMTTVRGIQLGPIGARRPTGGQLPPRSLVGMPLPRERPWEVSTLLVVRGPPWNCAVVLVEGCSAVTVLHRPPPRVGSLGLSLILVGGSLSPRTTPFVWHIRGTPRRLSRSHHHSPVDPGLLGWAPADRRIHAAFLPAPAVYVW